jgi:hypothetical protein
MIGEVDIGYEEMRSFKVDLATGAVEGGLE